MTFKEWKFLYQETGGRFIEDKDLLPLYIKYCDCHKAYEFKVDLDKGFQKPKSLITITGGTIVSNNSQTIAKLLTLCEENGIVLDLANCNITWNLNRKW